MRKVKVLYVIDKFHTAGTQKHILQLIKYMDKDRFIPYLCCLQAGGDLIREIDKAAVKILIFNISKIYSLSGLKGLIRLKRFIKDEKIDIVHTFLFSANVLGNIAARLAGAPVIISGRRDTGLHREGRWQHRQAYKLAHILADKVFANSKAVRDTVSKYENVAAKKISIIYNGVDADKLQSHKVTRSQVKRELKIKDNDKVVGIIATLTWVKGHKHFIAAARLLSDELTNIKFLIIGDGPLLQGLKSQVASYKLEDSVKFLGKRDDVADLLKIMDVSVNCSYSEGMSNAILESMAAGIPIVATDVDGNKELVVDGETGFLVAPKNEITLKDKIKHILGNESIAQKLSDNSIKRIKEHFSLSNMINSLENEYIKLLKEKQNEHYLN